MFKFSKKEEPVKKVEEEPKSLLERLDYKIEKCPEYTYYGIFVAYKHSTKKPDWMTISYFLKTELKMELASFGETTINDDKYELIGVGDTLEIAQKRLNDFCKVIELYDNHMIEASNEYIETGDLKENYIITNL